MQPTWTPADASQQGGSRRGLAVLVPFVLLLASCGGGGSDAETTAAGAPTTVAEATTTVEETTTTLPEVTLEEAGEELQALIDDAQDAIDEEAIARDALAGEDQLEDSVESASGLAEDLEAFQADLADLEVPEDAEEANDAIEGLDDAATAYIEVLVGYEDISEIPEYNEQYAEELDVDADWQEAVVVAELAFDGGGDTEDLESEDPDSEATTATLPEVTLEEAGEELQALIDDAQDAIDEEAVTRDALAGEAPLEDSIESASGLAEDLEAFRADLADLEVPEEAEDAVEALDDAATAYIEVLVGYEGISEIPEYNEQYAEEIEVDADWQEAVVVAELAFDGG